MKKFFSITTLGILLAVFFFHISAANAFNSYMELVNVDGTLTAGEYYTMDIYFQGVATDNLECYFAAVQWDDTLVSLAGLQYYDYNRPELFGEYTLWNGEELPDSPPGSTFGPWTVPVNEYWNISGAENLGHPDEFLPMASGENLMATLWLTAEVSGYYEDIATFIDSATGDLIMLDPDIYDGIRDGHVYLEDELAFYKDGTSSIMATVNPVPIPAAAWLLGSGLLGLIGIRRKFA